MAIEDWISIELAPKDGSRVLLNDAPCQDESVCIGRWNGHFWETVDLCQFGSSEKVNPTLFCKIPDFN